MVGLLVG